MHVVVVVVVVVLGRLVVMMVVVVVVEVGSMSSRNDCHNKANAHQEHEDDHLQFDRLAKDVFRTDAVVKATQAKYNAAHVCVEDKECRPEIVQ